MPSGGEQEVYEKRKDCCVKAHYFGELKSQRTIFSFFNFKIFSSFISFENILKLNNKHAFEECVLGAIQFF